MGGGYHSIIDECIPRKYVVVGPRDPDFVTPLVKMLLKKGTDCVDWAELMQPMMSQTKLMRLLFPFVVSDVPLLVNSLPKT